MNKIIYFDYCAVVIMAVLLVCLLMQKMTKSRANRMFLGMIVTCVLTTISDIVAVRLDMLGGGNVVGKYIFHTLYLYLHLLVPVLYCYYIFIRTDTLYRFKKNRIMQIVFWLPLWILTALLLLNFKWNLIFYLDVNDTYTRGALFWFLYFVATYYATGAVIYLAVYRKTVTKSRFIALVALVPFSFFAAIIQYLAPNMLVEMFANSCSILFIGLIIQRPEERIDSETGLEKLSAYVNDMKRTFLLGKPVEIIMINVVNSYAHQDMVGYDGVKQLKRQVVNQMHALNKKYKLGADLYYLNDAKFRFVVSENFSQVEEVAREMNQFFQKGIDLNQMDIHFVTAVCIARCPQDICDVDSLLAFGNDLNQKNRSGEVLYAIKEFQKERYDILKDIDRIIETALAKHNFEVYYQPIYSLKDKGFRSAEALLRLKDEERGFISPEIFIPAAEKSGAIHKIGEFVLEEVCKFISEEGFADLHLEYIEVNLSVIQCMQSNLSTQILDVLKKYHVRPEQINLEITETAASYSQESIGKNISNLRRAGILFSLDDFGTGYSNMRRFASLPFNLVKLDKSFTHAENSPRLMIVLKNTIEMIKAMNMQIVVEGVETEQMVKRFEKLQCEYIQGYFYSKPLSKEEFVDFLKKQQ